MRWNGWRLALAAMLAAPSIGYLVAPADSPASAANWNSLAYAVTLPSLTKDTMSSAPTPTATPSPTPTAVSGITGSQPYTDISKHANEYNEAKGALQWLGQVRFIAAEGFRVGLLRQDEVPMWQNILLGMVGVESVGRNFSLAAANSNWYSQGLTQLVYAHLYREEAPYDPLTNIRTGLRTVLRYYRMHGNRWDWAVAQHVTGASDETKARNSVDWNGTSGLDYAKRVVNVVWWANYLYNSRDLYPPSYYRYQATGNGGFDKAPLWDIFSSPALSYNWTAPSTSAAGYYQSRGADNNISQPINYNTWMAVPAWFYTANPAPDVATHQPRQPLASESTGYPAGHTLNAPRQETYPRQQWVAP